MDFDACLREHGAALWRVIASYAPRGPERDDLAQEVLVALWQATWTGASGPLPDVRATTEREARRHRRASVTVFLLAAAGTLGAISAFSAPEGVVHAIGWGIVAFCTALGAGFLLIQRGAGPS